MALGGGVAAFVAVGASEAAVAEAALYGADAVFVARQPELTQYRCQPYASLLGDLLRRHSPQAVLFSATTTGRDLAPRLAAMLNTGLAADCADLTVGEWTHLRRTYRPLLMQVRPAVAGGVLATCVCPTARPQMATVRPGTFEPRPQPRLAHVESVGVQLTPPGLAVEVLNRHISRTDLSLTDTEVIVAGGAGCDAHSSPLVQELAAAIGGKVAAARAAVEAGLALRALQIGQTGVTVRPRLYIGCGISGALQHTVGMKGPPRWWPLTVTQAWIFRLADYGIVADVSAGLPPLTAALRRASSARSA